MCHVTQYAVACVTILCDLVQCNCVMSHSMLLCIVMQLWWYSVVSLWHRIQYITWHSIIKLCTIMHYSINTVPSCYVTLCCHNTVCCYNTVHCCMEQHFIVQHDAVCNDMMSYDKCCIICWHDIYIISHSMSLQSLINACTIVIMQYDDTILNQHTS